MAEKICSLKKRGSSGEKQLAIFSNFTYNGSLSYYVMNGAELDTYSGGWRTSPCTVTYNGISLYKISFANPTSTVTFLVPGYVGYPTGANTFVYQHMAANSSISLNLNNVSLSFVFLPD